MRKKSFLVLLIVVLGVLFTACSSGKRDTRTIDDFISAYAAQGITVDAAEKPIFQLISATDGVIFYLEDHKVAIYEYQDRKALKKALEDADLMSVYPMKDCPINGKFMLESDHSKAIEIFNAVSQ